MAMLAAKFQSLRQALARPFWPGLRPAWTPVLLLLGLLFWLAPLYILARKLFG